MSSNVTNSSSLAHLVSALELKVLPLFYLVPPSHSSFATLKEAPNYVDEVTPFFLVFILLEVIIRRFQGLSHMRINDSIGSLTAGVIMLMLSSIILRGVEVVAYTWVYNNFRLVTLPWDSPWTWWLMFFSFDLGYYWFHRAAHELNLFWAAHQAHHSSEYYNLTTALRQSFLQRYSSWLFYLPLALAVPPSHYYVHKQFNLLYQFWIHTEVVGKLGPLEWILNTPSHHRVHHGRNRYCIDTNYAGVLIIWDRMFGTFTPEKDKVVYGLVHPLASFDPLWIQLHHVVYLAKRVWNIQGLGNKLSVLFKGPGWAPGTGRLGNPEDVPVTPAVTKPYNKYTPPWLQYYALFHFIIVIVMITIVGKIQTRLPYVSVVLLVAYFIFSLTSFGLMFDRKPICAVTEVVRLYGLLAVDMALSPHSLSTNLGMIIVRVVFTVSAVLWSILLTRMIQNGDFRASAKLRTD